MRVQLTVDSNQVLFHQLKELGYTLTYLAHATGYSVRTISAWKANKNTLPKEVFNLLETHALLGDVKLDYAIQPDWWQTQQAGRKGGAAFIKKYKTLGTIESRIEGGHASYRTSRSRPNSIYERKSIKLPKRDSTLFAEFIGVMIGDGSLTKYQASISTNLKTDADHAKFIVKLIKELFDVVPSIYERVASNCLVVTVSSSRLVVFLNESGLPIGHKIRNDLDIPRWIFSNEKLVLACLRGIFDTDGGIFLERHTIRKKTCEYMRMSFVSASPKLVESIYKALTQFGFSATIRYRRVNLERFTDINRYFTIVGSSNPKHVAKYMLMERSHSG